MTSLGCSQISFNRPFIARLTLLSGCIGLLYYGIVKQYISIQSVSKINNSFHSCCMENEALLQRLLRFQSSLEKLDNIPRNIRGQLDAIVTSLSIPVQPDNDEIGQKVGRAVKPTSSGEIGLRRTTPQISSFHSDDTSVLEVCPEIWLGTRSDYPFYYQGWEEVNCSEVVPFEKILTVLLYQPTTDDKQCPRSTQNILLGLEKLYPKVPVILSGSPKSCVSGNDSSRVHIVDFRENGISPGEVWNSMAKIAKTPYILIGRNLDDFIWATNLKRQVRILSYNKKISVAGGAVRNLSGHWRVGCFQASMKNYVLEYKEGYYTSRNECMFCNHVAGPFVTRTELVKSIPFDKSLPSSVVFEDWFWRIQQKSHIVVNCPDVMYLASDPVEALRTHNRLIWIPLVRKWELNRVVLPGKRVFSYSCAEAEMSCHSVTPRTKYFLMPPCCIEQLELCVRTFDELCRKHNLRYELDGGSVLGAVKNSANSPWDIDVDFAFYTSNLSIFKSFKNSFRKIGMLADQFSINTDKQTAFFSIQTPDIRFEACGISTLSHDNITFGEPFRQIPTQVLFNGAWVYAPHSPGTYARSRFGPEILTHSHSWTQIGLKDSFEMYHPGHFNKCPKPGFHGCLDQFSGDGNFQFQIPN